MVLQGSQYLLLDRTDFYAGIADEENLLGCVSQLVNPKLPLSNNNASSLLTIFCQSDAHSAKSPVRLAPHAPFGCVTTH